MSQGWENSVEEEECAGASLGATGGDVRATVGCATPRELQKMLIDAQEEIRKKDEALEKKDRDLVMAAELGACLIEDNENLKKLCLKYTTGEAIEQMLLVPTGNNGTGTCDSVDMSGQLKNMEKCKEELEKQVRFLESKVEALQEGMGARDAELKKLADHKRVAKRQAMNASEERELLASRLTEAMSRVKVLEEANSKLVAENARVNESTTMMQRRMDALKSTSEAAGEVVPLKEQNGKLQTYRAQAEREISELKKTLEESKKNAKARKYEADELKVEFERMVERQRGLEWDLVSERELNSKLQLRISTFETTQDDSIVYAESARNGVSDTGARKKSLFSEVDEERKELENRNNEIMRTHMEYVHKQEMMKDYVKRLLSLVNFKNSDQRVRKLEDALGQAESEKKELKMKYHILEKRLLAAEKKIAAANLPTTDMHPNKMDGLERECLIINNNVLNEECTNLKKEIRTLRVMNAGELEKLRSVESLLRDREDELVRAKASILQIRIELDTFKSRVTDSADDSRLTHTPFFDGPTINSVNSNTNDTIVEDFTREQRRDSGSSEYALESSPKPKRLRVLSSGYMLPRAHQ